MIRLLVICRRDSAITWKQRRGTEQTMPAIHWMCYCLASFPSIREYLYQEAGWHHWLGGRESAWTLGVGDGQGGLARCDSWDRKESDTTEQLNCNCIRKIPWWRKWQPTPVLFGNLMDRGAWKATVLVVAENQTRRSMHTCIREYLVQGHIATTKRKTITWRKCLADVLSLQQIKQICRLPEILVLNLFCNLFLHLVAT